MKLIFQSSTILFVLISISLPSFSQSSTTTQEEDEYYGRFYGGIESNMQYYVKDKGLESAILPDDPFRSNSYVYANYNYKRWTAGIQVEAYEQNALLNYNPQFEGTNLGIYYLNYKDEKWDVTLGHFYEQFGNGMIFRAWEDRALGINSAVRGARVKFSPNYNIDFTAFYGRQRSGFDVTSGDLFGFDANFFLAEYLNLYEKNQDLSLGFSYLGRYESLEKYPQLQDPSYEDLTNSFSFRADYLIGAFYANAEVNYKSKDGILNIQNQLSDDFARAGNAVTLNFGYSETGLGLDVSLRRVENMGFFSQREPSVFTDFQGELSTSFDYLDTFINFVPALTKQHHSLLANIYVFQAQQNTLFEDTQVMRSGETGGQIDFFYKFKENSFLGGKYGTHVYLNFATWYNLPGVYTFNPPNYEVDFFGRGNKYFSDYSIEIKKKLDDTWHLGFNYINQYYDQRLLGGGDLVRADIFTTEATYNLTTKQSIRIELEKMWAVGDREDWIGGTIEYNFNENLSVYVWDIWNYGSKKESEQVHYINVGGAYRIGAYRVALNYGRQRGGLVCVGGVCRFVPESSGLTVNFNTSF
ncbi:DUF6029 family protein [Psychroflexus salis]|uniref:Uncharacterized protein n=1 Tax=Psychroflexus salis TaxID=1526574 RepID=A0A917A1N6_9FLAO|nr:DUF6029 family protein [Psychroflexus salis]GGE20444.1 hypothetical protein GCM10010831_21920 [Psychroflexus salis]